MMKKILGAHELKLMGSYYLNKDLFNKVNLLYCYIQTGLQLDTKTDPL